ncbi:MAG: VOC family protein [Verrucomicrobiota bacterium JB022]|nr:VOC family protein [Verrucomicrobiota bacterium JB022]
MEARITLITLGVRNLPRAIRFYRDGLGFETEAADDAEVAFFRTNGTRLALFPVDQLAKDIGPDVPVPSPGFSGITLAHNVRFKHQVEEVLAVAERAGAKIVKPAQDTFWGGFAGYFTDPDGYVWEVAWGPMFSYSDAGEMVL